MAFIQWRPEMVTGVAKIDAEHQKLIAILNQLYEAMSKGAAKEVLGKVLTEMVAYTRGHFATEEGLMKLHQYPDYTPHKAEHDALTGQAAALEADFRAGKAVLGVKVANFLKDWLTNHILKTDLKYAPFFKSKHVR
jgi:hemerythrin-like metal-binding protein